MPQSSLHGRLRRGRQLLSEVGNLGREGDERAIGESLQRLGALAVFRRDERQLDQPLLAVHLAQLRADVGAEEGRVLLTTRLPHGVRRVRREEGHAHRVPALGRHALGELAQLRRPAAGGRELERLERLLHVGIAVAEARRVREDLGLDLRRQLLTRRRRLGCGVDRHGRQLSILERSTAQRRGDAVHEAESLDQAGLAVVEQEGDDAVDQQREAATGDQIAQREADLERHLRVDADQS
mmetsp:Transcript_10702/g.25149  ORF Transcript_10702/g.25149 Transcript_10702/m.25149 type:complete len:239 (-) Transcript_10702:181-897(-)|eukprot:scaffold10334_cov71-Phaeocystis_antarctica.AAC.3